MPRFDMPLELGLALLHSKRSKKPHSVYIFDKRPYQAQRSTSDVNGIDPQIHHGRPKELMIGLRNVFRQTGDVTTVPEMLASFRALRKSCLQYAEVQATVRCLEPLFSRT